MKNGKFPSSDGIKVEFIKKFYDHLKNNLLLVVRESKKKGRIHGPLMPLSCALSPKNNAPPILKNTNPLHATMLSTN
jgi:hypothetical protein